MHSRISHSRHGAARLADYVRDGSSPSRHHLPHLIGVLPGTGIGPSIVGGALDILDRVARTLGLRFEVREGGPIGEEAIAAHGTALPDTTVRFCADVLAAGGAILSGPGGGRYVYDLRRRFDLFCKLAPIVPVPELANCGRLRPEYLRGTDILVVRDQSAGVYQGEWSDAVTGAGREARHTFGYTERQVERVVAVAARAAADRRGDLTVVVKDGGIPGISALWREVAAAVARRHGLEPRFMNVDALAYELLQQPAAFDVIVASNLFGDIVVDLGGVLVGSRGIGWSGNFDGEGRGVFQTNHGCAHDLAGADTANPAAQLFSLAMLLREAFALDTAATLVEEAVRTAWRQGWRTADLAEPGTRVVGTRAMLERIADHVVLAAENAS